VTEPRRESVAGWIACAVIYTALVTGAGFQAVRKMPDFEVYWTAGLRARAAEPLYRAEDQHYQLKYLPAFAVLAIPAASIPLATARIVWFTISALLVPVFIALSVVVLPERRRAVWAVVLAALIAMAKFYGHELVLGQVNLLLGVIVSGAVVLLGRQRDVLAGLLLALAVIIKPYAVIFAPWLAVIGRGAAATGLAAGIALALAAPAGVYGVSQTVALHEGWWGTVTASTAPNLLNPDNVSVAAMFAKWLGVSGTAAWLAATASVALLIVAAIVLVQRRTVAQPERLEMALLLTLMPLLSPQGWDYVFLLATPAVAFLVNYADRLPASLRVVTALALLVAGLSVFDVMGRAAYRSFMSLSIVTICFAIVTLALATLRFRRAA
jgi:glycosyl transferase family 87